jgi:hypothetical protein
MSNRSDVLARVAGSNPIPTVDDVTQDDLADLRTLVEQRRLTMSTPVKHTPHTSTPEDGGRRWFSPVFAFAAAAVIVLLTLGIGSILLGGGDGAEPADEVVTPTTVATTVTTQAAPESTTIAPPQEDPPEALVLPPGPMFDATRLAEGWSMTQPAEDGEFAAVATTAGGHFVAAGHGPRVLFSLDGNDWTDANSAAIRDEAGYLNDVIFVGEDTVLIGHTCDGNGDRPYEPFPCPMEMRLWVGDPQLGDWESVDFGGFSCLEEVGECYATVDIAAGSSTEMLVTGEKTVGSETDGYTSQRATWVSADGMTTWSKYAFPTMEALELDEWITLRDDPVWVFGVGVQDIVYYRGEWIMDLAVDAWNWQDDTVRYEHILLSSVDGASWERIVIDGFAIEQGDNISALATGPDQLIAIGKKVSWSPVYRETPAVWVTSDTETWAEGKVESAHTGTLTTVIRDPNIGFLASGQFGDRENPVYDFWVSSNGMEWSPAGLATADGFWARSITSYDGVVVSTGITKTDTGEDYPVMGLYLWRSD